MFRSPGPQSSNAASAQPQLRKVRKGTRSCWECKRRKVRCIFSAGNTQTCNWCLSHGSDCVSQRYPDAVPDEASNRSMQDRMARVEGLLERLLDKMESKQDSESEMQDYPTPATNTGDLGLDVLDPASVPSVHLSSAAVVSIFQNDSFQSGLSGTSSLTRDDSPRDTGQPSFLNGPVKHSKLERASHSLLAIMPPREVIAALDEASSPWISQLLPALSSFQSLGRFSLVKTIPFELSSSHPATVAKTLMCVVVCLQQLPKGFKPAALEMLSHSVDETAESLMAAVCTLVTSDDETVATIEGVECLLLQAIYFINSGKPRRAWLSNRRALAIAQLMGLHTHASQYSSGASGHLNNQLTDTWRYIVHSDRYLALILGFPCGTTNTNEPTVTSLAKRLEQSPVDTVYIEELDRIATHIIDRGQSSSAPAFAATQNIHNALENLAHSVPQKWWRDAGRVELMRDKPLGKIYNRLNIQLWHHQLAIALHLPFMLDSNVQQKFEDSRVSCLDAARQLIERYVLIRTTFGTFSCSLTNFQAFTAAVILIFNMLTPSPTFEANGPPSQSEADWALVGEVINALNQSIERFEDPVSLQARSVLSILQDIQKDPQNQESGDFNFTIPYFGTISIARRHQKESVDPSPMADSSWDYSSEFMATIDMSLPILPDADELLQQWFDHPELSI